MQANPDPEEEQATEENQANDTSESVQSTDNQSDIASESPEEELDEAAKWKEISLRTAAEMENLRKRTSREREDAVRYANARLLEELLPVIDNFEMGMQAAAEDSSSMIYVGMDMVRKQLQEFLSAQGVEEVPTDGLFDPNLHDAVSQESCSKGEEGRVLKVSRKGYKLQDRLLRPASVVVYQLTKNEGSATQEPPRTTEAAAGADNQMQAPKNTDS
ncbi:MAG: nucleotide exchange factor GrpE [Luteolibacter sp.]